MGQGKETDGIVACHYRSGACTACDSYCRYNVHRVKEKENVIGNTNTTKHNNSHIQGG